MTVNLLDNDENLLNLLSVKDKYEFSNSQESCYVVNQYLFHATFIHYFEHTRPIPEISESITFEYNYDPIKDPRDPKNSFDVTPAHIVNIYDYMTVPDLVNLIYSCLAIYLSVLNDFITWNEDRE